MSTSMRKDVGKLLRQLELEHGCTVTKARRGGHFQIRGPSGGIVTVSHTSNDNNALRILRGDARRHLGIAL